MSPEKAAKLLREQLKFRKSAFSIWVWYDGQTPCLIVRLDPRLMNEESAVPLMFEGYKVKVQARDPAIFTRRRVSDIFA